jgi:hypothetical protein
MIFIIGTVTTAARDEHPIDGRRDDNTPVPEVRGRLLPCRLPESAA